MTVGSLFSGIGGLELGLERAGIEVIWQVEQDDYCTKILNKHWPHVPVYGDITEVDFSAVQEPDLICGGFPCRDISLAGKGEGIEGERSGLWWEMHWAIRVLRPRYAVIENVPALTHRGLDAVLGSLAETGYDAEWTIVSAAAMGAPHIRERIFIVAYPHRKGLEKRKAQRENLEEKQPPAERNGSAALGTGQWKTEPRVGRLADGVPNRVDRVRGLGNAVVPQVAEFVGRHVMRHAE